MKNRQLTQAEFAEIVGVHASMVGHWVCGRCRITAERAVQIEQATCGGITRHDLRPDVFGKRPEKAAV